MRITIDTQKSTPTGLVKAIYLFLIYIYIKKSRRMMSTGRRWRPHIGEVRI